MDSNYPNSRLAGKLGRVTVNEQYREAMGLFWPTAPGAKRGTFLSEPSSSTKTAASSDAGGTVARLTMIPAGHAEIVAPA